MSDFPVLISYSNNGYYGFAKNLLINLNLKIKNHKVHFFCLDNDIFTKLKALKLENLDVTFTLMNLNTAKGFQNYGTVNYNKITHTKMGIIESVLKLYNFIHFIDCDVVCINEPTIVHYKKYKDYDIVFQADGAEIWACTGNTSLRNTAGTQFIIDKIKLYQTKMNKNDQECLYQYFVDNSIENFKQVKEAKLCTYKKDEYCCGSWLLGPKKSLDKTYFFHANHVTGRKNKIRLLKIAKQWYIPDPPPPPRQQRRRRGGTSRHMRMKMH